VRRTLRYDAIRYDTIAEFYVDSKADKLHFRNMRMNLTKARRTHSEIKPKQNIETARNGSFRLV